MGPYFKLVTLDPSCRMFFFGGLDGFPQLLQEMVYVNTVGPRFETRAEIRSYRGVKRAHLEGMGVFGCCWLLDGNNNDDDDDDDDNNNNNAVMSGSFLLMFEDVFFWMSLGEPFPDGFPQKGMEGILYEGILGKIARNCRKLTQISD